MECLRVYRNAGIREYDFEAARRLFPRIAQDLVARQIDGLPDLAFVRMANHVGQGLVHRAHHGAGISLREMNHFGGSLQGGAHQAERLRIALEVQPQQEFRSRSRGLLVVLFL